MKLSNSPKKMGVAFAVNGQRQELQSSVVTGTSLASYNNGFPPLTMISKDAGGIPPQGKDFNQILYELSADAQWSQASGIYPYDETFSASIGGYPQGAVVIGSDGTSIYQSSSDDNTTTPGSSDSWILIPNNTSLLISKAEIASNDGQKYIGKCPTIADLRNIEPDSSDQTITVQRYNSESPLSDSVFIYDSSDTTSSDDDYRIIVSSGGARWKLQCENGIDISICGITSSGSNFGTILNKIISGEVSKLTSSTSESAISTIIVPGKLSDSHDGVYTNDVTVYVPSWFSIRATFGCVISSTLTTFGFKVSNDYYTAITEPYSIQLRKGKVFSCDGGGRITFQGNLASGGIGLVVGNDSSSATIMDVAGVGFDAINIRGFDTNLQIRMKDTYIVDFSGMKLELGNVNLLIGLTNTNSGEKLSIRNAILSGPNVSHVVLNSGGIFLTLDNTSMDYSYGDVIQLKASDRTNISVVNSHIEGWIGDLVISTAATPTQERAKIAFQRTKIVGAARGDGVTYIAPYASRRAIVKSNSNQAMTVDFDQCDVLWPKVASTPYITLADNNSNTSTATEITYRNDAEVWDSPLSKYSATINHGRYNFSGTSGTSVSGLIDSGTNCSFIANDSTSTAVYDTADSLGFQPVILNLSATTSAYQIGNQGLFMSVDQLAVMSAGISVKMSGVTSGTVYAQARFDVYATDKKTKITTIYGSLKNFSSLLTPSDTTLTTDDFVGDIFSVKNSYQASEQVYMVPSIGLTGFVGTVSVMLPAWWFNSSKSRGYLV